MVSPVEVSPADRCLQRFVATIRPRRPKHGARTLAMFAELREAARVEGLELLRLVYAGSLEAGTGLRRYQDRECSIPGQALDLVVELGPGPPPSYATFLRLEPLAARCFARAGVAGDADFRRDRLRWRLLPIFAQRGPQGFVQHLLVPGRAFQTSVRVHAQAVRDRTRASVAQVPSVAFNDCVRLLKWWRHARPPSALLPFELPSFALERLAIASFDQLGVREGFAATLAAWAGHLASFNARALADPAGDHRELLFGWSEREHQALSRWFGEGAEQLRQATRAATEASAAQQLALALFGPAVLSRRA